jgi:hypothetical protein
VNTEPIKNEPEYDPELVRAHLNMTPAQRLKRMYELHTFLWKAMPEKNKQAWEKLKAKGW